MVVIGNQQIGKIMGSFSNHSIYEVGKVDKLMKLCDELETQLNQSEKDSEMLMQAVLQEAFEGNKIEKQLKS